MNEECRKYLVQASGACSCVHPASTLIDNDAAKLGSIHPEPPVLVSCARPPFLLEVTIVCTVDGTEDCTTVVEI